jgi:hypothetical protein
MGDCLMSRCFLPPITIHAAQGVRIVIEQT